MHTDEISLTKTEPVMRDRKIKKAPLANTSAKLLGLVTANDLLNPQTTSLRNPGWHTDIRKWSK